MSFYRQPPFRAYGTAIGWPPLTPMVRSLMIALSATWGVQFVLMLLAGRGWLSLWLGLIPARVLHGEVWRVGTYMWLHAEASPWHLLFNLLFLWMFGGDLERHWGSRAFLRYYLVCGLGAGLCIFVAGLFALPYAVTLGASGAIYGLILAFGVVFGERIVLFMLVFPMKARVFALVMFGIAFVFSLGYSAGGVSHVAHAGGMAVGYLYLKRAWRVGEFWRELRWRLRRRRFRVMPPPDDDRWIH